MSICCFFGEFTEIVVDSSVVENSWEQIHHNLILVLFISLYARLLHVSATVSLHLRDLLSFS